MFTITFFCPIISSVSVKAILLSSPGFRTDVMFLSADASPLLCFFLSYES